jgi:hypothetical protein
VKAETHLVRPDRDPLAAKKAAKKSDFSWIRRMRPWPVSANNCLFSESGNLTWLNVKGRNVYSTIVARINQARLEIKFDISYL